MNRSNQPQQGMQLFDAEGRRLYCTEEERRAFLTAAAKAPVRGAHLLRHPACHRLPNFGSALL